MSNGNGTQAFRIGQIDYIFASSSFVIPAGQDPAGFGDGGARMIVEAAQGAFERGLEPPLESWEMVSHDVALFQNVVLVSFVFRRPAIGSR